MRESRSARRRRCARLGLPAVAVVLAAFLGAGPSWAAGWLHPRSPVPEPSGSTSSIAPAWLTSVEPTPPNSTPTPSATPAAGHPDGVLSVVVLGDSVPAGTACDCAPFGDLVAGQLGAVQNRRVAVDDEAVAGFESADVLDQLAASGLRGRIADADLVIVEVGANDFDADEAYRATCLEPSGCFREQLHRTSANLTEILRTAVARALTRAFDMGLATAAQAADAISVDVTTVFDRAEAGDPSALLAADGDHPNERGHRLLVAAVLEALGARARRV